MRVRASESAKGNRQTQRLIKNNVASILSNPLCLRMDVGRDPRVDVAFRSNVIRERLVDALVDEVENLRVITDLKVKGDIEPILGVVVVDREADLLLGSCESEEGKKEEAGLDGGVVGVNQLVSRNKSVIDLDLVADLIQF